MKNIDFFLNILRFLLTNMKIWDWKRVKERKGGGLPCLFLLFLTLFFSLSAMELLQPTLHFSIDYSSLVTLLLYLLIIHILSRLLARILAKIIIFLTRILLHIIHCIYLLILSYLLSSLPPGERDPTATPTPRQYSASSVIGRPTELSTSIQSQWESQNG